MSDTPETDAFTTSFTSIDDLKGKKQWVPSDFARKLERERDEANESSEAFSALAWKLEGERNEALNKLAKITKAADAVIDRWEQPAWKDAEPTGAVIYRLRDALGREEE